MAYDRFGVWRTISGRRVFIEAGMDLYDALRESGKFSDLKNGLTHNEEYAINKYMSSDCYALNEKLREGMPLTADEIEWTDNLDKALGKMPKYEGKVYRSILKDDPTRFVQDYKIGDEKEYKAYISSGDAVYDSGMSIQYVMQSKNGRDIRKYNPSEHEIIFKRNAKFRVTGIENYKSSAVEGYKIHMEEI